MDDLYFNRDVKLAPALTLTELADRAAGGAHSPPYHPLRNSIIEQAKKGELKLVTVCMAGDYGNSTISRETAIAWLHRGGFRLPQAWTEPKTFEQAMARIRALTEALQKAEAGRSAGPSAEGPAGTSKIERTTLVMLAALALEYAETRGPKFRGAGNKPNISAIAQVIEERARRAEDLHGASSANIRARLTAALAQYQAEGGTPS